MMELQGNFTTGLNENKFLWHHMRCGETRPTCNHLLQRDDNNTKTHGAAPLRSRRHAPMPPANGNQNNNNNNKQQKDNNNKISRYSFSSNSHINARGQVVASRAPSRKHQTATKAIVSCHQTSGIMSFASNWHLVLTALVLATTTTTRIASAWQASTEQTTTTTSNSQQQQQANDGTPSPAFVFARNQQERDSDYWLQSGRQALDAALQVNVNTRRAKSAVLFIGDGMSLTTITAARILHGQLSNKSGEEDQLAMDQLPNVALIKTYNLDQQVPDSAATATAILTGVKANFYTLGVNGNVRLNDTNCPRIQANKVSSLLRQAQEAGKSTGIVTNTRITHATPAAAYAHVSNRRWECDAYVPKNLEAPCKDIARQLVEDEPGSKLNVILGGGRRCFFGQYNIDPGPTGQTGLRSDGRNLINDWIEKRKQQSEHNYAFVNSTENLRLVNFEQTDFLLGLFSYSHMSYEELRDSSPNGEPSLTEMTEAAIKILSRNPNGYLLLVEGGRIDHAHHENVAGVALRETISLSWAVQTARNLVDSRDTLLAVTSDHAHALTMNGIAPRGNPILGLSRYKENSTQIPYTTLIYGNGPGKTRTRTDPSQGANGTTSPYYVQYAAIHQEEAFHDGSDVAIFASGPWAHLFQGVQEQSYIAHVFAYAMCLSPLAERHQATATHCRNPAAASNQDLNELLYGPSSTSNFYLPANQNNNNNNNQLAPGRQGQGLGRGGYNAYMIPQPGTQAANQATSSRMPSFWWGLLTLASPLVSLWTSALSGQSRWLTS